MKSLNFIWNWLELYFYYYFTLFYFIGILVHSCSYLLVPVPRLDYNVVLDLVGGVYIE